MADDSNNSAPEQAEKKPASAKMTDEKLLQVIAIYETSALGSSVATGATVGTSIIPANTNMTNLEIDRWNAINMYHARPMGNEIENRSQVVLPELRDTVEWIMPQLMRIFAGSKNICRFDPENQNDTDQSALETAYLNHVFMRENNGFFILHDFFKDALLLRNGYVDVNWEEDTKTSVETYTGLTELDLTQVMYEDENRKVKVLGQREYHTQVMGPNGPQLLPVFDIKIRITRKGGHVQVDGVPAEEVRVSPRVRGALDNKSVFVQRMWKKTRSECIQEGYDRELVMSASAGRQAWLNLDEMARKSVTDELGVDAETPDKSMEELEVRVNHMLVDVDGDGIAELRRVVVIGDKIADNEEVEDQSMVSCAPIRMPFRHLGISLFDLLADLQVMKTTLFRQGFDNLAIANNTRLAIDWRTVNTDDLLTSRPGGVVRTQGNPAESIMQIQHESNLVQQILPALEYLDGQREMRTGVGRDTMGLDMDVLQDVTKGGQLAGMAAAGLKIELIARMLAEGVKDIFLRMHGVLRRHQNQAVQFRYANNWVTLNPSEWAERTMITPVVGLGSGSRMEARANIMQLAQAQQALGQAYGLVGPKQGYETFKQLCDILGYDSPERFAMDPDSPEYKQFKASMPPPQPAPQVQVAQIRAGVEQKKLVAEKDMEQMRLAGELKLEQEKSQAELQHASVQAEADRQHQTRTALVDADVRTHGAVVAASSQREQNHNDLVQTLVKAFATIIASQVKADAQLNAAQAMTDDVNSSASGIR